MPALKIVGCCYWGQLTTRPFAGDDLQVLCILTFIYRIIQIACIIPFWVRLFLFRLHGRNFVGPDGRPSWCADEVDPLSAVFIATSIDGNATVAIEEKVSGAHAPKEMIIPLAFYLIVSVMYTVIDIALIMGTWSAASVGTPTEPRGRDKALRAIIWIKIIFMNILLITVLIGGIYFVAEGRRTNYGCGTTGEDNGVDHFEGSAWYTMFCLVMFTYAFELLFWPCTCLNQLGRSLTAETKRSRLLGYVVNRERRHQNTAAFLGGCFKCLQYLSCNRLGGSKIRATNDLKDAAIAFMDFFNLENTNFDIVLSDVWLAFKMLKRVHRERNFKLSEQARMDNEGNIERDKEGQLVQNGFHSQNTGSEDDKGVNIIFADEHEFWLEQARKYCSLRSVESIDDGISTNTTTKSMLRHTEASDVNHLRSAAHYSQYALGVYYSYRDALLVAGLLDGGRSGLYSPAHTIENILFSCFRLTDLGLPHSVLVYGTFDNDVIKTPYCVLVDEKERSVIVSICGSATLEDMVTDLQFSSSKMDKVSRICGVDGGSDMYAHRGMLTKCKWIYNDMARRKILSMLLPTDVVENSNNPCNGFKLIFTGHSLGAGIAAILGTMFRPTYPGLKCYAYCPPGCSVSLNLAMLCEQYVTSIVVGNDIIPRIRGSNFEILRFEFLAILSRIRVPKIRAVRDLSAPCTDKELQRRNQRLLHPKDKIPVSDYSKELDYFIEKRKRTFYVTSPIESRLNIPGKIIHLVHAKDGNGKYINKYVPYWESLENLREIDLSIEVLKEHSMDNLVIILNKIAKNYENGENVKSDEVNNDSVTVEPEEVYHDETDFSDNSWFILCSYPHGLASLIPTLLSVSAWTCSAWGNNICSLFFREVVSGEVHFSSGFTNGAVRDVAGLSLGLYAYGVKYYNEDVGDDYVLQCSTNLPPDASNDAFIKMSRGFTALALIIGFPVMCFLCITNCMMLSRNFWRNMSLFLFFVSFCQAMIFMFLLSPVCNSAVFPNFSELASCSLDNGSKLSIAGSVLWFLAAVFTAYIDRARLIEEQLKLLSLRAIE